MAPGAPRAVFRPRSMPGALRRAAVLTVGPLLWLLALVVAAAVEREGDAIAQALAIAGAAFALAFVVLLPGALARHRRLRRR